MNFKEIKKYVLVAIITIVVILGTGCGVTTFTIEGYDNQQFFFPIVRGMYGVGGNLDFLVYPMAWFMYFIGEYIVNNNYALVIIIATIVIRSAAWPIYGKTNDMSLKMMLLGPEQAKIQAKYAGKTDRESQQRMSMETMQLYKKYKVSFASCFMPLVQMPIFLAFYETLRRIPYSATSFLTNYGTTMIGKNGTAYTIEGDLIINADNYRTTIFGIDLLKDKSGGGWQMWGIFLIAFLVAVTQLATQFYSQWRTKKQKAQMESNIPEYRRNKQTQQQKQSDMMMKIMLYSMPVIMVIFIIQNSAALGFYWLIGNIYTAVQTIISGKLGVKRLEKLREKYSEKDFITSNKR